MLSVFELGMGPPKGSDNTTATRSPGFTVTASVESWHADVSDAVGPVWNVQCKYPAGKPPLT